MQRPIAEGFFRERSIEELGTWSPLQLEAAGRLAFPVLAEDGDTHFRRIAWDEALDRLARALRAGPPGATFFYASGRSSNEAAFLLQTLARAYGARNIHNCSCYCHQASGVALSRMVGSGTATVVLEDLDRTDLVVARRCEPGVEPPAADRQARRAASSRRHGDRHQPRARAGARAVPRPVRCAEHAVRLGRVATSTYSPTSEATSPCSSALLKGVVERRGVDRAVRHRARRGLGRRRGRRAPAHRGTRSSRRAVSRVADDRRRGRAHRRLRSAAWSLWAMGLTHHEHGVDNVLALGEPRRGPRLDRSSGHRADADPRPQQRAGRRLGRLHARR